MANKDMLQIIGSMLTILNNNSNTGSTVPKPYTPYVGSLFFGPNQELTFRNRVPKGRVVPGETDISGDGKTFGTNWRHDKIYNIHIDFFTLKGFTDTFGRKEAELLTAYNQYIEDTLRSNRIGQVTIQQITNEIPPEPAEDVGNNVWVTRNLIVFKERHC